MNEARCMKCKKQVEIKNAKEEISKNDMRMMKGECPDCSTKVCRILGKKLQQEENADNEEVLDDGKDKVESW